MNFIISESRLNDLMTKYMDNILSKVEVIEDDKIIAWGEGSENQMIYDKGLEVLFVRNDTMEVLRDIFGLEHHDYVEFIKDYMANKGYFVYRIV